MLGMDIRNGVFSLEFLWDGRALNGLLFPYEHIFCEDWVIMFLKISCSVQPPSS